MSGVPKNYGWVGAGDERTPEPTYTPDLAREIDGESDEQVTGLSVAADGLREILTLVFAKRKGSDAPVKLDLVFRRFICLVWVVRPELLDCASLSELSTHLHVTRAALSKMVRNYSDAFGIRNPLMKTESARDSYSAAQKRDHWRRRPKEKPPVPGETGGTMMKETLHPEVPHE
jgi:hypothetical protein